MNQQTKTKHPTEDAQTVFFLNFNGDKLGNAIKNASQITATTKKQAKNDQSCLSAYLSNCFAETEYSFLYDFYQERDINSLKMFIENLYTQIQKSLKESTQSTSSEIHKSVSYSPEVQKCFSSILKNLMKVNQSVKDYYEAGSDLSKASPEIKDSFAKHSKEGKKILHRFYRVFHLLDTCVGLLSSEEKVISTDKSSFKEDNYTQTDDSVLMNMGNQSSSTKHEPSNQFYSYDTFANRQSSQQDTDKSTSQEQTKSLIKAQTPELFALIESFDEILRQERLGRYFPSVHYDQETLLGPDLLNTIKNLHNMDTSIEDIHKYLQELDEQLYITGDVVAGRLNDMQNSFIELQDIKDKIHKILITQSENKTAVQDDSSDRDLLNSQIEDLSRENTVLKRELQKLVGRLQSTMTSQCKDMAHTRLESQMASLEEEREALRLKIQEYSELPNSSKKIEEDLKAAYMERDALVKVDEDRELHVQKLNDEKLKSDACIIDLKASLERQEREVQRYHQEYMKLVQQIESFRKQYIEDKNNNDNEQIILLTKSVEDLTTERQKLYERLEQAEREEKYTEQKTREALRDFEAKLQSIQDQNILSHQEIVELRAERKDLHKVKEDLQRQNSKLDSQIGELGTKLIKSTNKRIELEQKVKELTPIKEKLKASAEAATTRSTHEYPSTKQDKSLQSSPLNDFNSNTQQMVKKLAKLIRKGDCLLPNPRRKGATSMCLSPTQKESKLDKENQSVCIDSNYTQNETISKNRGTIKTSEFDQCLLNGSNDIIIEKSLLVHSTIAPTEKNEVSCNSLNHSKTTDNKQPESHHLDSLDQYLGGKSVSQQNDQISTSQSLVALILSDIESRAAIPDVLDHLHTSEFSFEQSQLEANHSQLQKPTLTLDNLKPFRNISKGLNKTNSDINDSLPDQYQAISHLLNTE